MKERQERKSREEWERINALWEKDKNPQTLFCKELGIEPSCFRYWRARLSKKDNQILEQSPQFAIAKLSSSASEVVTIPSKASIKIDCPNGLVVNLYCELNSEMLNELKPLLGI